jgi:hypothetical protein
MIESLKQLNLLIASDKDISNIFSAEVKQHYTETVIIPCDIFVYRCRHNDKITNSGTPVLFDTIDDISYRKVTDKIVNEKYGRCNLKGQGMFYGTVFIDNSGASHEIESRVLALREVINLPEIPVNNNELKILFYTTGQWILKKGSRLHIIHQYQDFHKANTYRKTLYDKYVEKLYKSCPKVQADIFFEENNFFAKEFAKYVDGTDHDYKITANYTNCIFEGAKSIGLELSGIVYPSSKTKGEGGENIALLPEAIQSSTLQYRCALVEKIYLYNNQVTSVPTYYTKDIIDNKFKWIKIDEKPSSYEIMKMFSAS